MTYQIETAEVELNAEDLDLVQGGLICRKAGGDQQEHATTGGSSIIAI